MTLNEYINNTGIEGFEPSTGGFEDRYSTVELYPYENKAEARIELTTMGNEPIELPLLYSARIC